MSSEDTLCWLQQLKPQNGNDPEWMSMAPLQSILDHFMLFPEPTQLLLANMGKGNVEIKRSYGIQN